MMTKLLNLVGDPIYIALFKKRLFIYIYIYILHYLKKVIFVPTIPNIGNFKLKRNSCLLLQGRKTWKRIIFTFLSHIVGSRYKYNARLYTSFFFSFFAEKCKTIYYVVCTMILYIYIYIFNPLKKTCSWT